MEFATSRPTIFAWLLASPFLFPELLTGYLLAAVRDGPAVAGGDRGLRGAVSAERAGRRDLAVGDAGLGDFSGRTSCPAE